jgi:hypothetical protein
MKVDELLKDDKTFSKSTLAAATKCLLVQPKKVFNDGTGKRVTKSLWCSKARPVILSEMLGGLDAGQSITIPGTSIVVKCAV